MFNIQYTSTYIFYLVFSYLASTISLHPLRCTHWRSRTKTEFLEASVQQCSEKVAATEFFESFQ